MSENVTAKALDLYCKGFSVFPVKYGQKYPYAGFTWKKYQTEKPSFEQTVEWFKQYPHSNIAILTGKVSNNLLVVDFDNITKYVEWLTSDRYIETYTIRTGRGYHCYFYIENMPKHTYKLNLVDIKNTGYVLSAGSLHPSGKVYQVHLDKPIATIASLDVILGLELVCYDEVTQTQSPPHHSKPVALSDDFDSLLAECAALAKRLPKDICDQIKAKLDILSVLGLSNNDVVTVGKRQKVECPVHDDHNPSLDVDLKTNRCFCYCPSCALHSPHGNDVINLYAIMHGLSDKQAMIALAKQLNLIED